MNDFLAEKKIVDTVKNTQKVIKKRTFSYIAAGLGLVAGLAWNDAIKSVIDYFIPTGSTIIAKALYAVIVTVIVVILLSYIEKSNDQ